VVFVSSYRFTHLLISAYPTLKLPNSTLIFARALNAK